MARIFSNVIADGVTPTADAIHVMRDFAGDGGNIVLPANPSGVAYALDKPLEVKHSRQSWDGRRTAFKAVGLWGAHTGKGVLRLVPFDADGDTDDRAPFASSLPSATVNCNDLADFGVEIGLVKHAEVKNVEIVGAKKAFVLLQSDDLATSPQDGLDQSFLLVNHISGYGDVESAIVIRVTGRSMDRNSFYDFDFVRRASAPGAIGPAFDVRVNGSASGAQAFKNQIFRGFAGGFNDCWRFDVSNGGLVIDNDVELGYERAQVTMSGGVYPDAAYDHFLFNFVNDGTGIIRGGRYVYTHGHLDRVSGFKARGGVVGVGIEIRNCYGAWLSKTRLVDVDASTSRCDIGLLGHVPGIGWLQNNGNFANHLGNAIQDAGKNSYYGDAISSDILPGNENSDFSTYISSRMPQGVKARNVPLSNRTMRDTTYAWGSAQASLKLEPGEAVEIERIAPGDGRPKTAFAMGRIPTGGGTNLFRLVAIEFDPATGQEATDTAGTTGGLKRYESYRDAAIRPDDWAPMVVSWPGTKPVRVVILNDVSNTQNVHCGYLQWNEGSWLIPPPVPYAQRKVLPVQKHRLVWSSNTAYRHQGTTPTVLGENLLFPANFFNEQEKAYKIKVNGNTSGSGNGTLSLVLNDGTTTVTFDIFAAKAISGTTSWHHDVVLSRDTGTTARANSWGAYGSAVSGNVAALGALDWTKSITMQIRASGSASDSVVLVTQAVFEEA